MTFPKGIAPIREWFISVTPRGKKVAGYISMGYGTDDVLCPCTDWEGMGAIILRKFGWKGNFAVLDRVVCEAL